MDWIEIVWKQVSLYVCVPYLLIFMLLSYLIKRNFRDVLDMITGYCVHSIDHCHRYGSAVSAVFRIRLGADILYVYPGDLPARVDIRMDRKIV